MKTQMCLCYVAAWAGSAALGLAGRRASTLVVPEFPPHLHATTLGGTTQWQGADDISSQ